MFGNILIVCVCMYSKCYKHILQIFRSFTLPLGLSAHLLIYAFRSDMRFQGQYTLLILALPSRIASRFLSAVLRLSSFKLELKTHLFSIYFQLCLNPSSSVCVCVCVCGTNVMRASFGMIRIVSVYPLLATAASYLLCT